jgi:hypothetical protein
MGNSLTNNECYLRKQLIFDVVKGRNYMLGQKKIVQTHGNLVCSRQITKVSNPR